MNCKRCGSWNPRGATYCSDCGANIRTGKRPSDDAQNNFQGYYEEQNTVCGDNTQYTQYGQYEQPVNSPQQGLNLDNSGGILFAVIAFFMPAIGLCLYFIYKSAYPARAKMCLKGVVVKFILAFIYMMFAFGFSAKLNSGYNDGHGYDERLYSYSEDSPEYYSSVPSFWGDSEEV